MKKILAIVALSVFSISVSAATYTIDASHANARFSIDHFGTSSNVGGIFGLTGEMQFDRAQRSGSIDVELPLANLQTGSVHFTEHLKSADIFNAEKYPEIRFQSTKFHFIGNKVQSVDGNLTLNGQTHPVKLKADKFNCYNSPMLKTEACGGDFSTTIDRTQWGVNYLVDKGMTKTVRINIQIEAGKK